MDSSVKYENPSPRLNANVISKIIFWWIIPLFKYGKNHDLEIKDLHNALPNDRSHVVANKLERNWKKEYEEAIKANRKPKLLTAIRKTFSFSYIYYGVWLFFQFMVLRVAQPFILGLLIWHFDPRSESTPVEAYVYATGVVVLSIAIALIQHHINLGQMEIGMRLRIACSSLVYRKILRLSRTAANETTGGQIINLLSNDVARFDQLFLYLHFIWIMPIQAALVAYLIWRNVQIASLAGVFLITIQTVPFQGYMGKLTSKFRMKVAVKTDERVRLMSEIISGIKVIKMYTWEKPFDQLVSIARKYEIDVLTLTSYLRGFNKATFVFTERTTLYFTLMAYVLLGNHISAAKVFTMAQYFNLMQLTMAIFYPMAVSAGAEALVSIKRLENFLLLEENKRLYDLQRGKSEDIGVTLKEVTASWAENSIANTLHDITLCVKPGKLCALVGPVGAGKSSLLQLILGEFEARQGQVIRGGVISYASQEPWLFAGSVRNNILFGLPYDEARYRRVTRVCALVKDFVQLPQGDKTLVGERGSSLSGGQRARINLARAVYAEADIYLLDDPLSAVDTHVGKQLFDECIMGFLGSKTRILVTHQVQYLRSVDHIIMLNNGVVIKQGTYREFEDNHLNLIKTAANEDEENDAENSEDSMSQKTQSLSINESNVSTSRVEDNEEMNEEPRETEELMAKGQMLQSLYWKYFSAGNSIFMILSFFVVGVLGQLGSSGVDYWVTYWSNQEELRLRRIVEDRRSFVHSSLSDSTNSTHFAFNENSTLTTALDVNQTDFNHTISEDTFRESITYLDRDTALWIYGGFIIASVIMTSARNLMFFKICMNSNRQLHDTMFSRLLRAPMRFFDTNPSGRILNRFSKDVGSVDEILPTTMIDAIQIFAVMIGILGQVIIIQWWTIFPMIVMAFCYNQIRHYYLATARDVKRLEGVGKSPVFSHVNSSLTGLTTIRSAGKTELVKKEFDSHQDLHTGAYYMSIVASTAFGLWLDAVTITFVAFITYSFVFLDNETTLSGNVGLAVSQILILCGMLQHGMRQTAEMVAQMTSVERILQFADLESEESSDNLPKDKPPKSWPNNGEIKFHHVYLRYDVEASPVLTDMNVVIEAGTKVGIVGRTGAGKSSIITALFNLTKIDGNIYIDGIDTKKIGLYELRSKISIIPQEPVLFSSSLRNNLDPFNEYEDAELWSALEQVQLKASVSSLDYLVNQGGTNFSVGQRQLLCLARAIVRNNKILVLDEATANVDPITDQLIQQTVRKNFHHCTVLTIAHRLNTIMDSDKVLVMEHGRIVEYDHPHVLLRDDNGIFKKMLEETGKGMTEKLGNISKKAYNDAKIQPNET